jgi:hypothetical protein
MAMADRLRSFGIGSDSGVRLQRVGMFAVRSIIVDGGTGMKRILILSLLGALLGGCVIVPLGYGYRGDGC